MLEGNRMPSSAFLSGGKPIPTAACWWSYKLEISDVVRLHILREGKPYSTHQARGQVVDVRATMKYVFDLAACIADDLTHVSEVNGFLCMIRDLSDKLRDHI